MVKLFSIGEMKMPNEQNLPELESNTPIAVIDTPVEKKRVDVSKALRLRMKGATYQEIADIQGVSPQAIEQRLSSFISLIKDPEAVTAFRDSEAEILDAARLKLVKNLVEKADDEKASVNNLAYAFTQIHNATRLIRGESTSNISQLTAIIQAASGSKHDATTKKE